jgi:hypothetical protein
MLNMPKITGPFTTLRCKWKFSELRIGGTSRNLRTFLKLISKIPLSRDYPVYLGGHRPIDWFDVYLLV